MLRVKLASTGIREGIGNENLSGLFLLEEGVCKSNDAKTSSWKLRFERQSVPRVVPSGANIDVLDGF